MRHEVSRRTLTVVGLGHGVALALMLLPWTCSQSLPENKVRVIRMVNLPSPQTHLAEVPVAPPPPNPPNPPNDSPPIEKNSSQAPPENKKQKEAIPPPNSPNSPRPEKPRPSPKPKESVKKAVAKTESKKSSTKSKTAPRKEVEVDLTMVTRKGEPSPKASDAKSKNKAESSKAHAPVVVSAEDLKKTFSSRMQTVVVQGASSEGADMDSYHALIREAIDRRWQKPDGVREKLEVGVVIRVLRDGTVEFVRIKSSSGHSGMDDSVSEAVRRAGRLSKPLPSELGDSYTVTILFRLE